MPTSRNSRSTDKQADALLSRFIHMEKDGSLARCVRVVVDANRRKARLNVLETTVKRASSSA